MASGFPAYRSRFGETGAHSGDYFRFFKTHFTVRGGTVKTAVAPQEAETPEERKERLDRQFEASQRLQDEQHRKRQEKKQAERERLRSLRGVYGERPM